MKRIALTGATGTLGRDVLAELVKDHLEAPDDIEVFVLGRGSLRLPLRERIRGLVDDCAAYCGVAGERRRDVARFFDDRIRCFEMDLGRDDLGIAPESLATMSRAPIDHFFHVAALTNFRDTPSIVAALVETNIHGTRRILRLAEALRVRQLAYVSSAYASGLVQGIVQPDDMNEGNVFRNPYERTKRDAEALVRSVAKQSRIRIRYFRPSTICGRLSRAPLGSIADFKVFYAWGAYLLRLKAKMVSDARALYDEPVSLDLRILLHPEAGLNIVPVDYCAKVMYDACVQDDPGESYHLVNGADTPHVFYTASICALLNIRGIRVVDRMPTGLNRLEQGYYRTVGEVFGPYVATPPVEFSSDSVRPVIDRTGTRCPRLTHETVGHLVTYAKRHHFGVDVAGAEEWRPTHGRPGDQAVVCAV